MFKDILTVLGLVFYRDALLLTLYFVVLRTVFQKSDNYITHKNLLFIKFKNNMFKMDVQTFRTDGRTDSNYIKASLLIFSKT